MSQEFDVDWGLLPQDPLKFFGLPGGFEMSELKRAYGRMIRKFKPETHPTEFQRIREAYERLEIARRYGLVAEVRQQQVDAWGNLQIQQDRAAPVSVFDRAVESPQTVFQDLQAKAGNSPQEFFARAFLSDFCERSDPLGFIKQLILGLREHSLDPGLQNLVSGFLENDLELDKASSILLALARVVPEDVFYRVTEGLWRRVIKHQGFEPFWQCQQICEKALRRTDLSARSTFWLRILRIAIWQAPPEWTEQQFRFIDQNSGKLDPFHEQELEFLARIRSYRQSLPKNVEELEQRLVNMMRDYCVLDEQSAVSKVFECFSELSRDVTGLIDSFEIREDCSRYLELYEICDYIANDVLNQCGGTRFTGTRKTIRPLAESAVADMAAEKIKTFSRLGWATRRTYWGAFFVIVLVAPYLLASMLPVEYFWSFFVLVGVASIFYFVYFKPVVLTTRWKKKLRAKWFGEYARTWRSRLVRYVQSCHAPLPMVMEELALAGKNQNEADFVDLVSRLASYDPVIYLLGISQQFVR